MRIPSQVKIPFAAAVALLSLPVAVVAQSTEKQATTEPNSNPPSLAARALQPPDAPKIYTSILDKAEPARVSLHIDLARQRLELRLGDKIAVDSPATTGRRSRPTPTGSFKIVARHEQSKPEDYGNFVRADGGVLIHGIYATLDAPPSGAKFDAIARNHVLKTDGGFEIHAGRVAPVPTTDGSVIVPPEIARIIFQTSFEGRPVIVIERAPAPPTPAPAAEPDPAPARKPAP